MIANRTPPNITNEIAVGSLKQECAENILWRAIFASDEWITLAENLAKESYTKIPGPILIGRDLSSIDNPTDSDQQHHHILLASNDWTGDLCRHQEVFFNSLRKDYKYRQKDQKVIFPKTMLSEGVFVPGITLYIQNLNGAEDIELPRKNLKRLFDKKLIQAQYSSSSLKKVQTIKASDVCGLLNKGLSTPGGLSPICSITFKTCIGPWQLSFITPESEKYNLKAICREDGYFTFVTGWEGVRKYDGRWWLLRNSR